MREYILPESEQDTPSDDDLDSSMPSSFLKSVPSPEQIVERAAEIRAGWTVQQRARNRADLIKAGATDRIEGFRWPDETPESTEIENWDDEDEFEEIP